MNIILRISTILLVFLLSSDVSGQGNYKNPWTTLSMVTSQTQYDEMMGMEITIATPLPHVEKLNKQEIEIKGYIIALSAKSELSHFMFSKFPKDMCFFCGGAGPESAMQVFLKKGDKIDYISDKVILKGILNIQKGDPSGLIYTLSQAELIKVIKS